jgi:hypothetical protein
LSKQQFSLFILESLRKLEGRSYCHDNSLNMYSTIALLFTPSVGPETIGADPHRHPIELASTRTFFL